MGWVRMEDRDRERLGERLREAREERGLAPGALAEELRVPEGTLGSWERGDAVPSCQDLVSMASTLGTGLPELLGEGLTARMAELSEASRGELRTVYGALCLGWVVVFALEVAGTLGLGRAPWAVYAALLVPALLLSWRALALERERGLRTAREVADYLERGARPADDEAPLAFLGWALKGVCVALVVEALAGALG